ncbi:YcnI family protein [Streptosporangium sp. NPDC051022]|uniref:YcnI family copper-binding membrane protein n=1 Tax=Streptosporangium sp. NPDC051022 TaxID=3155752 RepID=UPI003436A9A1
MSLSSACRRAVTVTAGVTALTLGLALPALAHVSINPGTAEQGGFTKVAFRVPNERDNASTNKIEVSLSTDHPLPFVSVRPVPGWDVKVVESTLPKPVTTEYGEMTKAVTKITWSGGKIEPHQFQEFEVSMGMLPKDTDTLVFPTVQSYTGGEVVKWADPPKADGSEAEHPAPTLKLTPASADGDGHGAASADPSAAPSTPAAQAAPSVTPVAAAQASSSDGTARLLGGAGLLAGIVGVVAGVLGLRRGGRTS